MGDVFSAYAEVVPLRTATISGCGSILRVRGGSSAINQVYNDFDEVFSAYAEVVPTAHPPHQ